MSLGLNVNIDPEEINRTVAQAIIDSSIGAAIKQAIEKEINDLNKSQHYSMDTALQKVVHELVMGQIRDAIMGDDYLPKIKAAIAEQLSDAVITDLVTKMWEAFRQKVY